MTAHVETHYGGSDLIERISANLRAAGKDLSRLKTVDLAAVDEFHIRGRRATLELAERMNLSRDSRVLDIGSGLGGPARTLAQNYGCHVTGIDLKQNFCDAATVLSQWVGLDDKVCFKRGDATSLEFDDGSFDAVMTIHVAMNILAKEDVYAQAKRVLKPGGVFAVYDILQGEGGSVLFPVPWAREPSISHLVSPDEMRALLTGAGFKILDQVDSTEQSHAWFEEMAARLAQDGPPSISFQLFLGADFPQMARNQVRNLTDKRIRTVSYYCQG